MATPRSAKAEEATLVRMRAEYRRFEAQHKLFPLRDDLVEAMVRDLLRESTGPKGPGVVEKISRLLGRGKRSRG